MSNTSEIWQTHSDIWLTWAEYPVGSPMERKRELERNPYREEQQRVVGEGGLIFVLGLHKRDISPSAGVRWIEP